MRLNLSQNQSVTKIKWQQNHFQTARTYDIILHTYLWSFSFKLVDIILELLCSEFLFLDDGKLSLGHLNPQRCLLQPIKQGLVLLSAQKLFNLLIHNPRQRHYLLLFFWLGAPAAAACEWWECFWCSKGLHQQRRRNPNGVHSNTARIEKVHGLELGNPIPLTLIYTLCGVQEKTTSDAAYPAVTLRHSNSYLFTITLCCNLK